MRTEYENRIPVNHLSLVCYNQKENILLLSLFLLTQPSLDILVLWKLFTLFKFLFKSQTVFNEQKELCLIPT